MNATSGRAEKYRLKRPASKAIVPPGANAGDLARAALEERYLGAFWHLYLPEAREFQPRAMPYTNGGWTVALPKLYEASPRIRKIMLAVCLATAGQRTGREQDKEEGLKYYTSSLEGMAAALRDGGKVDHATLLITARLFSLYEVGCFLPHVSPPALSYSPMSEAENGSSYLASDRFSVDTTRGMFSPRRGTGGST